MGVRAEALDRLFSLTDHTAVVIIRVTDHDERVKCRFPTTLSYGYIVSLFPSLELNSNNLTMPQARKYQKIQISVSRTFRRAGVAFGDLIPFSG